MSITFKGVEGGGKIMLSRYFYFILPKKYKFYHIRQKLSLNQEVKGWF
jgi:hypothetical protein